MTARRSVALVTCAASLLLLAPAAVGRSDARRSACTGTQARETWVSFLKAFAAGNYARLDTLFAAPPSFGWYSSNAPGARANARARDRDTLITYFRARHRQRDRMNLLTFTYNGNGNFVYRLRRSAQDYRAGAWFGLVGKGAVTCAGVAPQLVVVSVGGPGSDRTSR
jgi:hypothetical protein